MEESVRKNIDARLDDFRIWTRGRSLSNWRLVQYCGVDLVGAINVALADIESQITSLLCEGFYVDWAEKDGCAFLRVWEFGGPDPDWPFVFAEQPLADIQAILRAAGDA